MAVDPANLNFYQCLSWTEGDAHGGDINLVNKITSEEMRNVFDDVTDSERIAGDTEYRKIYVRNDNVGADSDWTDVRAWIKEFTISTDDEIFITVEGSNSDTQADAKLYTSWVQPDTMIHADVLVVGTLISEAYHHIWIKRVMQAGGSLYPSNYFTLIFRSKW